VKSRFLRKGGVLRDSLALGSAQAIGYLLPLATTPILIHRVGMQEYGRFALVQVLGLLTQAVVDYGFSFTATRAVVNMRHDSEACGSLLVNVTLARIGLLLICLLVAAVGYAICDRADYAAVLLCYFPYSLLTLSSIIIPLWYFQGIGNVGRAAFFTGMSRLCSLATVFLLVHPGSDLSSVAFLYSMPALLVAVYFWFRELPAMPDWGKINWREMQALLVEGRHVFATNALSIGLTNSGPLIISAANGAAAVGIYSAAERVAKTVSYVYGPLTQAVYPRVVAAFSSGKREGIGYVKGVAVLYFGMALGLCSLTFFGSAEIMRMLGVTEIAAVFILKILSIWVIISVANNIIGLQLLTALGQSRHYMRCFLACTLIYVTSSFCFTIMFDATGPAFALTLSEACLFSLVAHRAKKILSEDHVATA
jgi:PST family polysaccharide transporter